MGSPSTRRSLERSAHGGGLRASGHSAPREARARDLVDREDMAGVSWGARDTVRTSKGSCIRKPVESRQTALLGSAPGFRERPTPTSRTCVYRLLAIELRTAAS